MPTTLSFTEKVHALTRQIKKGQVMTYQRLATALGRPRAARAVGNALNKSPGMPKVPCHRVIRSDGAVGGFASGTKAKIKLLLREGVEIKRGRVNLKRFSR